VTGGTGIDLLFAGSGNDTLIGGSNNDYLFGGSGQTRLDGGAGNNYLRSGSGPTTFVFDATGPAHDVVSQFKPGTDVLEVHEIAGRNITAAQLIATATQDTAGDAVLHLDASHDITLLGVAASQLQQGWFHLI
jgi:Ca2+-binding RTX toxin-like protein